MYSFISLLIRRLLIVIVSVAVILAVTGCGRTSSEAPKPAHANVPIKDKKADKPVDEAPKLQLSQKGVTLSWVEKGQVRMKATGKESKYNDLAKVAAMLDFSAQLYDNGKLSASLSAPKAVADTLSRVVTATGGVTLKSMERNTTIKASWMKWYAKEQKVVGDGGVKITSSMGTLEGAAFVADTAMKTITIKDSAKGLKF